MNDPRVVYYLCGGKQIRWGNFGQGHEIKHLVEVPTEIGESSLIPLIKRTDEQLVYALGVNERRLVRECPFSCLAPEVQWVWDSNLIRGMGDAIDYALCRQEGSARRVVILMGDVFWTDDALKRLIECESPEVALATDDVDVFGISVHANSITSGLKSALRVGGNKDQIRATLNREKRPWNRIAVCDWTQDFDLDWEHMQFRAGLSKNNYFQHTPGQVRLRKAMKMAVRRKH